MKARLQIDASGLQKALRELPSQMRKSSHRAAATAGAKALADRARALAPVRTGALRASIKTTAGKSRTGAAGVVYFKGAIYRIAHLVEFGTAHSAARPFIRPAIQQAFEASIGRAADALAKHLAKNAEKLAGAGGKAHFARGLRQDARKAAFLGRRR